MNLTCLYMQLVLTVLRDRMTGSTSGHQQDVASKMTGATFQEPYLACRRKVFQICL